jgi:phytoene dehydrogenase-like protein
MSSHSHTTGDAPGRADVIVVGAGHNGLTAACYLARAGLDVLVVEASPTVGGMTSTNPLLEEAPQHLFNEGAIHATGIFWAGPIPRDLELHRYGLKELVVDPVHVQLGPEGESIAFWKDRRRTIDEIRKLSPHDARAWAELSEVLDAALGVMLPYMNAHPTRPLTRELLKGLAGLARNRRLIEPLIRLGVAPHAEYIDEHFEHPLTRGILATAAAFLRMKLDATAWPLIYMGVIQNFKSAMFVGGTGALPASLQRYLEAHGGRVRTSAPVEEFVMRGNRVAGVRLAGGEELLASEAVVTTCNPKVTLTKLLPDGNLPDHLRTRAEGIPTALAKATSLKINIALKGRLGLRRHEAWRGDGLHLRHPLIAWHTLEQHVAGWEAVTRDDWPDPVPLGCVTVPTATDPSQAPEGQDTLWLWSGVLPVHPREPWEQARERVTKQVLDDCANYYDGIEELEIGRSVLGGPDIEQRFNAPDGNVYHVDPLLFRFGPLRPAMGLGAYKTPVAGLYLSGAGTHPTGGVCGLPGKFAAETVLRDGRSGGGSPIRRVIRAANGNGTIKREKSAVG